MVTISRIKAHTDFRSRHESGIVKMLGIGLGKRDGAAQHHRWGVRGLREPSFVDQSVVFKLGELEVVRNIIAHNRSLSDIELRRLELYTHDVLKAIGAIKD